MQVGRTLASLMEATDVEVELLLERCHAASASDLDVGLIKTQLLLRHKYLDPVPVEVTIGLAGAAVSVEGWLG